MKNKLKSNRKMEFIKRVVNKDKSLLEDHFRHKETGIVLVRTQRTFGSHNDRNKRFVTWCCPELGSGNANIDYWLKIARSKPRKLFAKCVTFLQQ